MTGKKREPSWLRVFIITGVIKTILRTIAKVDAEEFNKIPLEGPFILCMNHINFLEVPLIQCWLRPRKMRGFVKRETWENPIMAYLFNTFRAIPVDRSGINRDAFREVREYLSAGNFITVAPEGTRSGTGILQEGKPGIVSMSLMTGAPIIPVVHYGGEKFWENFKRFRRTKVRWRVGRPFRLESEKKPDSTVRDEMTREIMYKIAELLPEELRGPYSKREQMSSEHLRFLDS